MSSARHGYFAKKIWQGATPALVNEIVRIQEKYSTVTSIDFEVHNLDRKCTMDFKSDGGSVKGVVDEKSEHCTKRKAALIKEKSKNLLDIHVFTILLIYYQTLL